MNRLNLFLLGAGGLLLTACSQEDVINPATTGDGNYTVTVKLPSDLNTRSFGDGYTATKLNVAVYDASTSTLITTADAEFASNSLQTQVSFNLANGKSYNIAFFAQSAASMNTAAESDPSNAVYTFDATNKTVTVNYENMTSANNLTDAYDCFYKLFSTGPIGQGSTTMSVELTRPVAQVNWGTSDLNSNYVQHEQAFGTNGQYIQSTLTGKAYTTLNLLTGGVTNETNITLTNFAAPTNETFPFVDGNVTYKYVAMNYLLVPSTASIIDELTLSINNGLNTSVTTITNDVEVTNAPVQGNYRTNIYGNLLTTNTNIAVTKDPNWGTPDYNVGLAWDGSSTTPDIDDENNTVTINRASDLAGLAALVNDETNPNDFDGYTVELNYDFDMSGLTFPSIGSATRSGSTVTGNAFKGVFNGNGHTISNLTITGTTTDNTIGLISYLDGEEAEVKDIVFENLLISSTTASNAGVVGVLTNGASVSGITINSGSVSAMEGVAGVVGRILSNGTVTECENHANVTATQSNCGGIVGAAYYTQEGSEMTISNCKNYGNVAGGSNAIGGVVGLSCATVTGCTNAGTITGGAASTGGIIGEQKSAGSISGCTNSGTVNGGQNYGAGGIVGWVRYENGNAYARQNVITVTGCNNSADINGWSGVGGIVGVWYMCGECNSNTNTAGTITASNGFAAGIVGNSQWTGTQPNAITGTSPSTSILTVNNNISTTPLTSIIGQPSAQYVYINNSEKTTATGNTNTLPANP